MGAQEEMRGRARGYFSVHSPSPSRCRGCRGPAVNVASPFWSPPQWSTGFGPAQLKFMEELAVAPDVPAVLSLSLGSLSWAACNLLCRQVASMGSHTYDECTAYTSKQRQVCMYTSNEEAQRTSTAFMKLGLRGVSIFAATGDGGAYPASPQHRAPARSRLLMGGTCRQPL